ncbi:hypothetical protein GCM10009540_39490 [Streptomyces turgidiscabies]
MQTVQETGQVGQEGAPATPRSRKMPELGVTAVRGNDRVSQPVCGEPTLASWTTAPKSVRF